MDAGQTEAVRIAYGTSSAVVVEVDVDVLALVPHLGETSGPICEGLPPIARDRVGTPLVQPQIAPVSRAPQRGLPPRGVTEAEGRLVLRQYVGNLVAVPRIVARLEGHPDICGKGTEGRGQQCRISLEVGGKLQEHGSDLVTQSFRATEKPPHGLCRLAQAEHMGEVAARLEAEHKVIGRRGIPAFEGGPLRQTVEDIVDLDRLETVGVEGEPLSRRQSNRVQATPPIGVLPTRGSDDNAHDEQVPLSWQMKPAFGLSPSNRIRVRWPLQAWVT